MIFLLAASEAPQIDSTLYFAAAGLLIFTAAFLAGTRVQRQLPVKWLLGIAALSLLTLALIWMLLSASNRKESPAPDYSAPTGTP